MSREELLREAASFLRQAQEQFARPDPDFEAILNECADKLEAMADEITVRDCEAVIWFGSGHQSQARCERTDAHTGTAEDPHYAHHHRTREELEWAGDEGITGFFDESPL